MSFFYLLLYSLFSLNLIYIINNIFLINLRFRILHIKIFIYKFNYIYLYIFKRIKFYHIFNINITN